MKKPDIQMFQQRVLLEEIPEEPNREGKIVVPQTVAKNLSRGKLIAVNDGKLREGDLVLFDNRQAVSITLEGKEYLIAHETQIIAVLGKKKPKIHAS